MSMGKRTAECRGCGKVLRGTPYEYGGDAYDYETGEKAKVNHYGGYVCSESCDRKASINLESSMPGGKPFRSLSQYAKDSIRANWGGL